MSAANDLLHATLARCLEWGGNEGLEYCSDGRELLVNLGNECPRPCARDRDVAVVKVAGVSTSSGRPWASSEKFNSRLMSCLEVPFSSTNDYRRWSSVEGRYSRVTNIAPFSRHCRAPVTDTTIFHERSKFRAQAAVDILWRCFPSLEWSRQTKLPMSDDDRPSALHGR